jgi:hypothetical protein
MLRRQILNRVFVHRFWIERVQGLNLPFVDELGV